MTDSFRCATEIKTDSFKGNGLIASGIPGKKRNHPLLHRKRNPYGQFRIEIQAFRNGKAVSVVNKMVVTRLPHPLYLGKDAPDSPFGIHTN